VLTFVTNAVSSNLSGVPGLAISRWLSFSICSGGEPLKISGTDFYQLDALPAIQPESKSTEGNLLTYHRRFDGRKQCITNTNVTTLTQLKNLAPTRVIMPNGLFFG